jgi:hemerythrin-like metal-binding protein
MPIMLWDQSLDVGVAPMNREHQDILDLMNRIYDARAQGREGAAVNQLVADLGGVCTRHFADEEAYMASIGYRELSSHKILHQKLLERFSAYAAEIKAAHGVPSDDFFNFLKFWLTSHIKGVDVKYGLSSAAA